ncbi:hypothetical protein ACLI08_01435 [Flavobacterium sp. RNTU_13]|uniref:hypothetical protein n=1 Tax=Flavobacterium sp. RNTU_13 TaxID=3375145 RepID=UPI003987DFBA
MDLLIEATIILIGFVLFFTIKNFLPTYFAEKGKNLATKEDIEHITEKVEKIKAEFVKNIEFIKADLTYLNQNKFSIKAAERDALIETNNKYSEWLNVIMSIRFTDINHQNYEKLNDYYHKIKTSRLNFHNAEDKLHLFLHDEELMKVKFACIEQTLKLEFLLDNTLAKCIEHFRNHNIYFDNLAKISEKDITPDFLIAQMKESQKQIDEIFYKFIDDKNELYIEVHRTRTKFITTLKKRLYDIMS